PTENHVSHGTAACLKCARASCPAARVGLSSASGRVAQIAWGSRAFGPVENTQRGWKTRRARCHRKATSPKMHVERGEFTTPTVAVPQPTRRRHELTHT